MPKPREESHLVLTSEEVIEVLSLIQDISTLPEDSCYLWTGYFNRRPLYIRRKDGEHLWAHRLLFAIYHGQCTNPISNRSTCNNPHCVNPLCYTELSPFQRCRPPRRIVIKDPVDGECCALGESLLDYYHRVLDIHPQVPTNRVFRKPMPKSRIQKGLRARGLMRGGRKFY